MPTDRSSFKRSFEMIVPPVIWQAASRTADLRRRPRKRDRVERMPPEFDEFGLRMFEQLVVDANRYVEYGCGGSTIIALSESDAQIFAVESSSQWFAALQTEADAVASSERLDVELIDLGPLGDWGTPLGYSHRRNFRSYVESPWRRTDTADLVLIDGRFRVASFCCSMLHCRPGSVVLFDDFVRPEYHVVEECIKPEMSAGRMAKFVVSEQLDRDPIERMMEEFIMVWD
jgi:hypothetical protein